MIEYENLGKLNSHFHDEFISDLDDTIKKGWFIRGNKVENFEQQFASYCETSYCVGCANGQDALMLALKSFCFPEGSEIIVSANTFIASIYAIIHAGLKPVLCEPDIQTYNIDPEKIKALISDKTVAIIAVHLYGKCCDIDTIKQISTKYNLKIIEDAAQAHGASYKGKKSGSLGDIAAFSFYPAKTLGALGDGGAITTNNAQLSETIRMISNYGMKQKYHHELLGYNSRLDEVQAGFLSIKLKHLDTIVSHKRKLAGLYQNEIKSDFIKPIIQPGFDDAFHIYPIRHSKRDNLKKYLLSKNIKTEIHYPIPPHQQIALQPYFEKKHYPISEEIHNTILSLPCSYIHSESDILHIIEVLNNF